MGCGKSKHNVASGNTVLKRKKSSVKPNKGQEIGTQTKDDNNSNVDVNVSAVEAQKDGDNVVNEVVVGKVDVVDSNGVKSETENANVKEETVLQKGKDVVAGENANVGEEKVLENNEEFVGGGDDEVKSRKHENSNEGEEKAVDKGDEVGGAADEVESRTEKENVQEKVKEVEKKNKEVDGEEGVVPQEASEKSKGEEDDALRLEETDQKVNDVAVAEEKKTGDGKDDVSVKEEILAKKEAAKDLTNVPTSEGEERDLKAVEEQKEKPLSNEDMKAN